MSRPLAFRLGAPLISVLALLLGACNEAVRWVGVRLLYEEVPIAKERVLRDLRYLEGSEDPKHRLDLFLPEGEGWPVLVFVHGGGWDGGDKSLVAAGADVYANLGRYAASHGIGTAVINYRLQTLSAEPGEGTGDIDPAAGTERSPPTITWREQVADIARAVAWVHANVAEHGGDPKSIFLAGHSAGAQLSAYVALNPRPLAEHGLAPDVLCGVIPVSGPGYDLADARTYELGARRPYYEARFRAGDPGDEWQREASAITYVSAAAPPFLLIHGSREWKSLRYQNGLLDQALREAGAQSRLLVTTQTHGSIMLALSRDDRLPGSALVDFIRRSGC